MSQVRDNYVRETVDIDDPNRCQGSDYRYGKNRQCRTKALEGQTHCPKHASRSDAKLNGKADTRMYRFQKYKEQFDSFVDHDDLKTLNEEIAIMRVVLQEILDECDGNRGMTILYSSKLSDMCMRIKDLILAARKLEIIAGTMINKSTVIMLAQSVVQIINDNVKDPAVIEKIGFSVYETLQKAVELPDEKD